MAGINGRLLDANTVPGTALKTNAELLRTQFKQESGKRYMIPLTSFRVHDALQTNLPGTPATDDLGLVGGTFGSASPTLQTEDLDNESNNPTVNYARALFQLPPEYQAGQSVTIRVHAGMKTTISDTTATIDVECRESDLEEGVGDDLCTTAAQSINSLTLADKDFTIDASGLEPGDVLDIRLTTSVDCGSVGTAVIAIIGQVELLLDIRG